MNEQMTYINQPFSEQICCKAVKARNLEIYDAQFFIEETAQNKQTHTHTHTNEHRHTRRHMHQARRLQAEYTHRKKTKNREALHSCQAVNNGQLQSHKFVHDTKTPRGRGTDSENRGA